jgi:hypothetical protein
MLAGAGLAAVVAALAIWVVPAFSGGTANEWTWVSGTILSDNTSGSTILVAYNESSADEQVTVKATNLNGTTTSPSSPATATIPAGQVAQWGWDCSIGFGCPRVYELHTHSADVVPSLLYDENDASQLLTGLVSPGDFQVFGPNQLSTAATDQNISNANAFFQAEIQDLQGKTADLQDKTAALQGDTTKLKSDTAALEAGNATLQGDTAQLRKTSKKLQKQLKKVLKAVR